jgi:hypothetical protein
LKAWEWGGFVWQGADDSPIEHSDLKRCIDFNHFLSAMLPGFNFHSRPLSSLNNSPIRNHQQAKTMNINISFKPDGTAQCLWTDAISLHELGRLEIHRATNIEFNNTTQKWEVRDQRGKVRFIAKSRSACLDWEQRNLQVE